METKKFIVGGPERWLPETNNANVICYMCKKHIMLSSTYYIREKTGITGYGPYTIEPAWTCSELCTNAYILAMM